MKVIKEGFDMYSDMVAYLKELDKDGVKMTKLTAGNKLMRKFPSATEDDVAKAIKKSKVKLEAIENVPDKATTVLNPTMARAKEVSDKKDKEIKDRLKKANREPELKKPFLGSVKPNVPSAIKEPSISLDENLFEEMGKEIVDGAEIYYPKDGKVTLVNRSSGDKKDFDNVYRVVVDGVNTSVQFNSAKPDFMSRMWKLMDESLINEAPDYDLRPQFDSRKSFYRKARVNIDKNGNQILYSYNTPVAKIVDGAFELLPMWNSSQTTLRHVKEFMQQNGLKSGSVKEIAKTYPVGEMAESLTEGVDEKIWDKVMRELDADYKRKKDRYPGAKRYSDPNVTYDGDIEVTADSEEGLEFAKQVAQDFGCEIRISKYNPPKERNLDNAEKGYPSKYIAKIIIPRVKNESLTEGYSKDYTYYDLIDECKRIYREGLTSDMDDSDKSDLMLNAIDETIDNMTIYNSDILNIILSNMNWGYINDLGLVEGVDNVYEFGRYCIYEGLIDMATEMIEDVEKDIEDEREDSEENIGA